VSPVLSLAVVDSPPVVVPVVSSLVDVLASVEFDVASIGPVVPSLVGEGIVEAPVPVACLG